MANPNKISQSTQEIQNQGFDAELNVPATLSLKDDGSGVPQRAIADTVAMKVTTVSTVTYIGIAAPGTPEATAKWQARKIDSSSGTVITWADQGNFTQVATDLTALTYE